MNAIVIRRGGAGVVLVVDVVDVDVVVLVMDVVVVEAVVVLEIVVDVVDVVVVAGAVVTDAAAELSGTDSPRRTADTSAVVHATVSESPSSAATRLRIRPGSHGAAARTLDTVVGRTIADDGYAAFASLTAIEAMHAAGGATARCPRASLIRDVTAAPACASLTM